MPIPAFQLIKVPKVIYSTESDFNGQINVIQIGDTLKLKVDNIDQSLSASAPNARRLVWGRTMDVLKQNEPNLKSILVLGLGGATVQHFLADDFPGVKIVSVDIDPTMYEVSKKYFGADTIPNHHVIVEDACRVIVDPQDYGLEHGQFQAAYVDIYLGQTFPDLGNSGNFMNAIKNMVVPGGLIIINRIYTKQHQDDVNNFIKFVDDFLHDVQTLVVAGYTNSDNVLIYGRT